MNRSILALLVSLAIFFAIGTADLRLPGLQYDEAADGVPALELLKGQPPSSISRFTLFGREFPMMMLHHIGPTTIYTAAAGMALLGPSPEALRLSQLAVGAAALCLLWALARAWGGDRTAALATLLCATMPPFIWWSRAGANYTVPLLPLAIGMLLFLTKWWRTGRGRWLALAALLFGAGVTTKILFVWLVIPLAAAVIFGGSVRKTWAALARMGTGRLAAAAVMALIGLAPLIAHNAPNLDTLRFILVNAGQTQSYGHNNLDFANNLARVMREFSAMMNGDTLHFGAPAAAPLGALALAAALIYQAIGLVRRRAKPLPGDTARVFLISAVVGVLPASTVTTSSVGATYVFVLVPFAWLLVALACGDFVGAVPAAVIRRKTLALVTVLILLVANHLAGNGLILSSLQTTGGRGGWSDAINHLNDDLVRDFPGRELIAMDWGFSRNLQFLSGLRLRPREVFEARRPEPSARFADVSAVLLRDTDSIYLFHAPGQTFFGGHWAVFEREALKARKEIHLVRAFTERDGAPNILVYTATDVRPSFAVSPALGGRNASIGPGLVLLGGRVTPDLARKEIEVVLQWQRREDRLPDDTVLVHIVNEATGEVVAVGDGQPVYGRYGFSKWAVGEVVIDPHWVILAAALKPGVYQARVGAYATETQVRRPIADPLNDAAGNSLMLARFVVN